MRSSPWNHSPNFEQSTIIEKTNLFLYVYTKHTNIWMVKYLWANPHNTSPVDLSAPKSLKETAVESCKNLMEDK